jgi:hypothetical protein
MQKMNKRKTFLEGIMTEEEIKKFNQYFISKYEIVPHFGLNYAGEKFSAAVEYLATSPCKLTARIWGAYRHYLRGVLWSFDYKSAFSKEGIKSWEFLQKEFNYKMSPFAKSSLLGLDFSRANLPPKEQEEIILNRIRADAGTGEWESTPPYIAKLRKKARDIAKAIVYINSSIKFMRWKAN